MAYHKNDIALALEACWELLKPRLSTEQIRHLLESHACLEEIDEYGAYGPVGIGLGCIGGHAIGQEE